MKRSVVWVLFWLFFGSCITEYKITTPFREQLVIQALITDQPGPYLVKLTQTIPIEEQNQGQEGIHGALVSIADDEGNTTVLGDGGSGNYYTDSAYLGVAGRTYVLSVKTQDGHQYRSKPEKLQPVGDITNLHAVFVQNEDWNANQQITSRNGFNVLVDADVLPEQEGRIWWRWTGTFEIFTYPWLRTRTVTLRNGMSRNIPDPPFCSAFFIAPDSSLVGPFHDCTCCDCWVTQFNSQPLLSDPRFTTKGTLSNVSVAFVEANVRTFYAKYRIEVEQYSLSQSVFDFWNVIRKQQDEGSNLFQTPPQATPTNLESVTADSPRPIGYFAASGMKKKSIVIDRSQIPYHFNLIDTLVMPCTQAYPYSSTKRPRFW